MDRVDVCILWQKSECGLYSSAAYTTTYLASPSPPPLPHCKVLLSSLLLEMSFSHHSLPLLPCADKLEEEYIQRFLGELTPYQESNLIQLKQKLSTLLKDKVCFSYSGYCVRRVAPREHFEISVQNPSFWALLAFWHCVYKKSGPDRLLYPCVCLLIAQITGDGALRLRNTGEPACWFTITGIIASPDVVSFRSRMMLSC